MAAGFLIKFSRQFELSYLVVKITDGGHEQLISNGGKFKPAFAERDKKQTRIHLRGISTNWLKNQLCPSLGFLGYVLWI
jgi:hypothetical protein